MLTSRS